MCRIVQFRLEFKCFLSVSPLCFLMYISNKSRHAAEACCEQSPAVVLRSRSPYCCSGSRHQYFSARPFSPSLGSPFHSRIYTVELFSRSSARYYYYHRMILAAVYTLSCSEIKERHSDRCGRRRSRHRDLWHLKSCLYPYIGI